MTVFRVLKVGCYFPMLACVAVGRDARRFAGLNRIVQERIHRRCFGHALQVMILQEMKSDAAPLLSPPPELLLCWPLALCRAR